MLKSQNIKFNEHTSLFIDRIAESVDLQQIIIIIIIITENLHRLRSGTCLFFDHVTKGSIVSRHCPFKLKGNSTSAITPIAMCREPSWSFQNFEVNENPIYFCIIQYIYSTYFQAQFKIQRLYSLLKPCSVTNKK